MRHPEERTPVSKLVIADILLYRWQAKQNQERRSGD